MQVVASGPPQHLELPSEALEAIPPALRERLEREVFRVNDRYLVDFIEEFSFCPFARSGRVGGATKRYMYYADTTNVEPLLELMLEVAADESQVVVQVVLPMIEVGPKEWALFCQQLTAMGNARWEGGAVLACAPLHPELAFNMKSAATMIPLLRRSPDPTIQWVRLDGLESIYEGRSKKTAYVEPGNIMAYLEQERPPSLYDRIANSNLSMAKRLRVEHVEELLAEYARDGKRSYARVLLEGLDDE